MTPIFQTRSTATTHDVPAAVPVARPAFVALDPRQDPRQDPGRMNLSVQGNIHIHYDAQTSWRFVLYQTSTLFWMPWDYSVSIESNIATTCCCASCWDRDSIVVNFFDRSHCVFLWFFVWRALLLLFKCKWCKCKDMSYMYASCTAWIRRQHNLLCTCNTLSSVLRLCTKARKTIGEWVLFKSQSQLQVTIIINYQLSK